MQNLRQRTKWNALVEHLLQYRISTRNGVAHNNQVGTRLKVARVERLRHRNPQLRKKIRHWRIRRRIGPGHAESALFQHACERRHRRATNPNEMGVFVFVHEIFAAGLLASACAATAASRILSLTCLPSTSTSARTPIGSVMLPVVTWPERTPNATGTPNSPTIRSTICSRVYP